jgi:hypothetical protein
MEASLLGGGLRAIKLSALFLEGNMKAAIIIELFENLQKVYLEASERKDYLASLVHQLHSKNGIAGDDRATIMTELANNIHLHHGAMTLLGHLIFELIQDVSNLEEAIKDEKRDNASETTDGEASSKASSDGSSSAQA